MSQSLQMPLGVQLRDEVSFSSYYPGPNDTLLTLLDRERPDAPPLPDPFLFLYGPSGVGCSHLLQAACYQNDHGGGRSSYIPMHDMVAYPPRVLDGLETLDLVCIDNIEAIAGHWLWESAVFNLFNALRERGTRLLVAADCPPRQLPLQLPDLVSRMSWGLVFQVQALSDEEKLASLRLRARLRGLELTEDVARFVLTRGPRTMQGLFEVLARLDGASLRAKRRLSIPFVKQVMRW